MTTNDALNILAIAAYLSIAAVIIAVAAWVVVAIFNAIKDYWN